MSAGKPEYNNLSETGDSPWNKNYTPRQLAERALKHNYSVDVIRRHVKINQRQKVDRMSMSFGVAGYTALHYLAKEGETEMVRKFLDAGANPSMKDLTENGNSPLHLAVIAGNADLLRLLLGRPSVNKNQINYFGDTPVHSAAKEGNVGVLRILIGEFEANPCLSSFNHLMPLHLAARLNKSDVVKYLVLDCGLNPNIKVSNNDTPLEIAFKNRKIETIIALVVDCRVDVDKKNENGDTLLHRAAKEGDATLVKVLVEKCHAKTNIENNAGEFAAEYSSWLTKHLAKEQERLASGTIAKDRFVARHRAEGGDRGR